MSARDGTETSTAERSPRPRSRARPAWRERLAAWRDQHLYGLFSSLGRLAARPLASAMTVLVLGFALALPLLFWLGFDNVRELSGDMRQAREVTVFARPDTAAAAVDALAAQLRQRQDVADVLIRTPQQGLAEFRQLSGFGIALDLLDDNPLPSVLVVTPRDLPDVDTPPLVADLKNDPRVDLVQYDAAWRRKLSSLLHFGERMLIVLAALLAAATLLVIGNTVRMDIQARSAEVSVMQLIGASNGFVRRPFLYSGLWYGLLGGVLALVVVGLAGVALNESLGHLLDSYGHRLALRGINPATALVVIAGGALLGWLGAFAVVTRHLVAGKPRA